jgi:Replication-relaxation
MPKAQESEENAKQEDFVVKPHHDRILEAVYKYHFMTAERVTRLLHKQGTLTTVRATLGKLAAAEYLLFFYEPRPTPSGSVPKIFMLGNLGYHRLKEQGLKLPKRYQEPDIAELQKNYLFLKHNLAVTDFLITAKLLEKKYPAIELYDFQHERTIKQDGPMIVTIEKWTSQGTQALDKEGKQAFETVRLYPDGFLDFRIVQPDRAKPYRFCLFLEVDRNTESDEDIRRKIRGYLAAAKSGECLKRFGTKIPYVGFASARGGVKRRDELRKLAEDECKKLKEQHYYTQMFAFTALPDGEIDSETLFLSPVWYSPFANRESVILNVGSR